MTDGLYGLRIRVLKFLRNESSALDERTISLAMNVEPGRLSGALDWLERRELVVRDGKRWCVHTADVAGKP